MRKLRFAWRAVCCHTCRSVLADLVFLRRALGLIRAASGRWMTAWAIVLVGSGLLPAASVFLTKRVVDALSKGIGGGTAWSHASAVVVPGLLMVAVMIGQRVLSGLSDWINTVQTQLVQDH